MTNLSQVRKRIIEQIKDIFSDAMGSEPVSLNARIDDWLDQALTDYTQAIREIIKERMPYNPGNQYGIGVEDALSDLLSTLEDDGSGYPWETPDKKCSWCKKEYTNPEEHATNHPYGE